MSALLLAVILASTQAEVVEHIKELQPNISDAKAQVMAQAIEAASQRYGIEPHILTAIAAKESNFRSGIKACWLVMRYQSCQVTCDYGVAQINELWIKKWDLDAHRLQNDPGYNLRIAARILRDLQKTYGHEPMWFTRYHSGTPSKRQAYEESLTALLQI